MRGLEKSPVQNLRDCKNQHPSSNANRNTTPKTVAARCRHSRPCGSCFRCLLISPRITAQVLLPKAPPPRGQAVELRRACETDNHPSFPLIQLASPMMFQAGPEQGSQIRTKIGPTAISIESSFPTGEPHNGHLPFASAARAGTGSCRAKRLSPSTTDTRRGRLLTFLIILAPECDMPPGQCGVPQGAQKMKRGRRSVVSILVSVHLSSS